MKFIGPTYETSQDWEAVTGHSREALVEGILRDEWVQTKDPNPILIVEELCGIPFALAFNCYQDQNALDEDRDYFGDMLYSEQTRNKITSRIQFDVLFAYRGEASHMRLRDVYFGVEKHKGLGSKFLAAVIDTALDIGVDKVFVEPGMDGSWYWTSRGAIIQNKDFAFDNIEAHAKSIINYRPDEWSSDDFQEFKRVFAERDVMGLHKMIARDDLLLQGWPMRRFLLKDFVLGECVFDLQHPWTQRCLQKCLGFDAQKFVRCSRPITKADLKIGVFAS